MATNYTVRQGDCIYSIAFANGFFADTIWNHPNNAELKKNREDPNVLLPGDTVFIPDRRLKEVSEPTNQVHKFRCKNTPKTLRIQFQRLGKPIPNLKYKLTVDGQEEKSGQADSGGWLTEMISPAAKIAVIETAENQKYELSLGHLDPVDEISGIQGRLRTLGFYAGAVNGRMNDEIVEALKEFQNSRDLEATGEADDATKTLLTELTGG